MSPDSSCIVIGLSSASKQEAANPKAQYLTVVILGNHLLGFSNLSSPGQVLGTLVTAFEESTATDCLLLRTVASLNLDLEF